jgi:hypothetical protein
MNEELQKQQEQIESVVADPKLREQLKALVLGRISVMPDTLRIAIGSMELGKDDIARHVEEGDAIGTQMMEMELGFMRDLASGAIYAND